MKPPFRHSPWDISFALAAVAGAVLTAAVCAVAGVVVVVIGVLRR